ncbi:PH domain-containing protein [Actinomadura rubteroloni]|uniref:PH domain-containing protein n=1 Tax=Actinomadura rubteroloni TaxID=1926885 RepID=UPI001F1BB8CC|nr:PH domain-containing protein [Actinomadura rubteroloni]
MIEGDAAVWRVPPAHTVLKFAGAAAVALVAVFAHDTAGSLLAGVAAAGLAALALRDVLAPERLRADAAGVTVVAGFAGRRRVAWPEITGIEVDERRRALVRSRLLEIRTEDDLHLLSAYDLGADVADVAGELDRLRAAAQPGSASSADG